MQNLKEQLLQEIKKTYIHTEYIKNEQRQAKVYIRLTDDKLKELCDEYISAYGTPSEEEKVALLAKHILKKQGGILHFIDDTRSISNVTDQPGIYVHSSTIRQAYLQAEHFDDKDLLVRHTFFDYYLDNGRDVMDVAFHYAMNDVTSPYMTFSCHSSDSSCNEKVRETMKSLDLSYKEEVYKSGL